MGKEKKCGAKCSISSCLKSYRNAKNGPPVRLFKFPNHKPLRYLWAKLANIQNVDQTSRLCHAHFEKACLGERKLKLGAVPTLNLPVVDNNDQNDALQITENMRLIASHDEIFKLVLAPEIKITLPIRPANAACETDLNLDPPPEHTITPPTSTPSNAPCETDLNHSQESGNRTALPIEQTNANCEPKVLPGLPSKITTSLPTAQTGNWTTLPIAPSSVPTAQLGNKTSLSIVQINAPCIEHLNRGLSIEDHEMPPLVKINAERKQDADNTAFVEVSEMLYFRDKTKHKVWNDVNNHSSSTNGLQNQNEDLNISDTGSINLEDDYTSDDSDSWMASDVSQSTVEEFQDLSDSENIMDINTKPLNFTNILNSTTFGIYDRFQTKSCQNCAKKEQSEMFYKNMSHEITRKLQIEKRKVQLLRKKLHLLQTNLSTIQREQL